MVNSSPSNSPPFGIIFFGTFSKHFVSKSKEIERMDPLIAGLFLGRLARVSLGATQLDFQNGIFVQRCLAPSESRNEFAS